MKRKIKGESCEFEIVKFIEWQERSLYIVKRENFVEDLIRNELFNV